MFAKMKKLTFILFLLSPLLSMAQPISVDIDDNAQNRALSDTVKRFCSDTENMDFSVESFIKETYQIPAYNLYGQLWDTEHLRSKQFAIPFSDGQLKIILVESYNTPFVFPCRGEKLLDYGQQKNIFHPGTDFALPESNAVYACFDGAVRIAKIYGEYNKIVVIRHYNGLETVYANLGKIYVKPGQIIKAGHLIGIAGTVGKNTFASFHFEVRFMNETFDPALLLDFEEHTLAGNILTLEPADFNIKPIPQKKESAYIRKENSVVADSVKTPQNMLPVYRPMYHVVQKGETLYKISKKYNISVEDLMKLNNLTETSMIFAGQKLKVK
jgi:murein DD-endopeptidase MepM/ murein hydrolase activator NlpD